MRKSIAIITGIIGTFSIGKAQIAAKLPAKPQLVIGIVIDQMRTDYIYRYWSKFGEGGFKRLVNEGYFCKNTHYNYVPTYTAPGHASLFTGTTPAVHGIIGNDWFDRQKKQVIYCTDDANVKSLPSQSTAGLMSPRNLLTTSVTDELRLATNLKSKVIGIALKDRGAILPAGHTANAAYWFDGETGNFISSSYYMKQLPEWVDLFNKQQLTQQYLSKPWTTLLPLSQYTESLADDNPYEGLSNGEKNPVFPHHLPEILRNRKSHDLLRSTPFGNSLTKDFAIAAIKHEQLGKGAATDFLTLSFSSTDYIGHQYGPKSVEVQDAYLRLDKDLEELFIFLDGWLGKANLLLFLTADHGAVDVVSYLSDTKISAGYIVKSELRDSINKFLKRTYGIDSLLTNYINQQIYLNHTRLSKNNLNITSVSDALAAYLLTLRGIENTITAKALKDNNYTDGVNLLTQKGFNGKRSGDICITYAPAWTEHEKTGTTHGSSYVYDTHVPLIWYGWNIKHGNTSQRISITDIAPTISVLLEIPFPNGCTGNPIESIAK